MDEDTVSLIDHAGFLEHGVVVPHELGITDAGLLLKRADGRRIRRQSLPPARRG